MKTLNEVNSHPRQKTACRVPVLPRCPLPEKRTTRCRARNRGGALSGGGTATTVRNTANGGALEGTRSRRTVSTNGMALIWKWKWIDGSQARMTQSDDLLFCFSLGLFSPLLSPLGHDSAHVPIADTSTNHDSPTIVAYFRLLYNFEIYQPAYGQFLPHCCLTYMLSHSFHLSALLYIIFCSSFKLYSVPNYVGLLPIFGVFVCMYIIWNEINPKDSLNQKNTPLHFNPPIFHKTRCKRLHPNHSEPALLPPLAVVPKLSLPRAA